MEASDDQSGGPSGDSFSSSTASAAPVGTTPLIVQMWSPTRRPAASVTDPGVTCGRGGDGASIGKGEIGEIACVSPA